MALNMRPYTHTDAFLKKGLSRSLELTEKIVYLGVPVPRHRRFLFAGRDLRAEGFRKKGVKLTFDAQVGINNIVVSNLWFCSEIKGKQKITFELALPIVEINVRALISYIKR